MTDEKGLTLVEVLVAMFIAVITGGLLLVIMANSAGIFYKESSKVDQGLKANDALMSIKKDIKGAISVESSYSDGSFVYTSGPELLILKTPALDGGGNFILDVFDRLIYLKEQDKLKLKIFPDIESKRLLTDRILATALNSVKFEYFSDVPPPLEVAPDEAAKVRVTLTLKQKAGQGFDETVATSEANLRND